MCSIGSSARMPGVSRDEAELGKADAEARLHQFPIAGLAVGAQREIVAR